MNTDDSVECVKCGNVSPFGAEFCIRCTWPFSIKAWDKTKFRIKKITIDTSCINVKKQDRYLNILENWADEGFIQIQMSSALIEELEGRERRDKAYSIDLHPPVFILDESALDGDAVLAGPDMEEQLRNVLFPTTKILTKNQEYDVEHLRSHVLTGGDAFVTRNPKDFIVRGKQETLATLGIWVFDPPGLVDFLLKLYGWKPKDN
ncbi:MAG: hypothetical protein ABSB41_17375 [Anaerolineales bacterium]